MSQGPPPLDEPLPLEDDDESDVVTSEAESMLPRSPMASPPLDEPEELDDASFPPLLLEALWSTPPESSEAEPASEKFASGKLHAPTAASARAKGRWRRIVRNSTRRMPRLASV
jgi:hypothetical protein